jgi:GxxExxY protein
MSDDELGTALIGCALRVHSTLGPGLLESVYQACLYHEPHKVGIPGRRAVEVPIEYDGVRLDGGLKLDLLLGGSVIAELKAVERLLPIHTAQLLTYLKLTGLRIGYLLNLNLVHMRDGGIRRVANGPSPE